MPRPQYFSKGPSERLVSTERHSVEFSKTMRRSTTGKWTTQRVRSTGYNQRRSSDLSRAAPRTPHDGRSLQNSPLEGTPDYEPWFRQETVVLDEDYAFARIDLEHLRIYLGRFLI